MDSTIVFFGTAMHSQVEKAAGAFGFANGTVTQGSQSFYLHRYSIEDQLKELTADEVQGICNALGGSPASAFQVSARHGPAARLALEVVSQLMSQFKPAVLDDDFGHLWSSAKVSSLRDSKPDKGIYALRDA